MNWNWYEPEPVGEPVGTRTVENHFKPDLVGTSPVLEAPEPTRPEPWDSCLLSTYNFVWLLGEMQGCLASSAQSLRKYIRAKCLCLFASDSTFGDLHAHEYQHSNQPAYF